MSRQDVSQASPPDIEVFDFIIIGAGVSGISLAHSIATNIPMATYIILEAREQLGGTWDLFQYPGIRSDSDIFTFGYSWNPWRGKTRLASGSQIVNYLSESAAICGADSKVRYNHLVLEADWSLENDLWTVQALKDKKDSTSLRCQFLLLSTGYYDYQEPFQASIPGLDQFRGPVIHPQFWPKDLNYYDKEVVIIGSGATAVTLLPNMATQARHVTMLQRSPTYIASLPMRKAKVLTFLGSILPGGLAHATNRMYYILFGYILFYFSTLFPNVTRSALEKATSKSLPSTIPVDPHFRPRYKPWEQRMCFCPDGDFFEALRSGKASVVTDTIEAVTEDGIMLKTGGALRPDIIVAATGLKIQFAGGIKLSVGGQPVDQTQKYAWRGCMIQDVPNMIYAIGYMQASWTLSVETTGILLVRLWKQLRTSGTRVATPKLGLSEEAEMRREATPKNYNTATYLQNAGKTFPKQGKGPWAPKWNHYLDTFRATWCDITRGLELS